MPSNLIIDRFLKQMRDLGVDPNAIAAEIARQNSPNEVNKGAFKKLEISKGMYQDAQAAGLSLTEFLEREDPSENYPGVRLDAFQRQLVSRDLVIAGPNAVSLEEFYNTPENRVLFPEFINREVRHGQMMGRHGLKAADIVAIETTIDSGTYEVAIADETGDFSAKVIPEGAKFPKITIKIANKTVDLRKHGMMLMETYEHARRIRANKMAVFLRLIGWSLEKDMAEDALDVSMNGNTGNSNSAFAHSDTGLNYNNLVEFWAEFDPYESAMLVLPKAGLTTLLQLTEFKDPAIASQWLTGGQLITPLGQQLRRMDVTALANKVHGIDTNFALEGLTERGASLIDKDKVIDGQWNEMTISFVRGFAKIIGDASGTWDYS